MIKSTIQKMQKGGNQSIKEAPKVQDYAKDKLFRYVVNYEYCFRTFCKGRWLNRNIIEVFQNEFKAFQKDYYPRAIKSGKIKVNDEKVDEYYVLKNGDSIEHYTIRRELPVYNVPLSKIFEDEEIYAVEKPPSMPVHPCGAYNKNSLVYILKNEEGLEGLRALHRLDKLTSGLVLLAKNKEVTKKYLQLIKDHEAEKVYLARVEGDIGDEEFKVEGAIFCDNIKQCSYSVAKTEEDLKIAKDAITSFKKLWYHAASDSSLVECHPKTGRTHQIRVHLRHAGFPILNDYQYGGRVVGNLFRDEILAADYYLDPEECLTKRPTCDDLDQEFTTDESLEMLDETVKNSLKNFTENIDDKIMEIMLHAYSYTINGKTVKTNGPYWAEKSKIPDFQKEVEILDPQGVEGED